MSDTNEIISPEMQRQLDHMAGKQVVVEYLYNNGKGVRRLLEEMAESPEFEAWDDAAFTNGPPLVEIRMRWDEAAANELRRRREDPGHG